MAEIGASFAVEGSTYRELEIDTKGLTIDQVAQAIESQAGGVFLCHACSSECQDPELGELAGFTIDGVEYVSTPDGWRRADEPAPRPDPLREVREALANLQPPRFPPEAREALETFTREFNESMRRIAQALTKVGR